MERPRQINSSQIRAARALLRWSQDELARKAGISRRTLTYLENDQIEPLDSSLAQIRRVTESEGIEFVWAEGKIGVLMKSK